MPVPSLAILISAVLVLSCGQTDRITEADDRYTHPIIIKDLYGSTIISQAPQ